MLVLESLEKAEVEVADELLGEASMALEVPFTRHLPCTRTHTWRPQCGAVLGFLQRPLWGRESSRTRQGLPAAREVVVWFLLTLGHWRS